MTCESNMNFENKKNMDKIDRLFLQIYGVITSMTLQVVLATILVGFSINEGVVYLISKLPIQIMTQLPNPNYIGAAVCIILYGMFIGRFWKYTKENYGQILISTIPNFTGAQEISDIKEIKRSKKQIVILEGLTGKWPWLIEAGEPISLKKTVPIDIEIDCPSSDSKIITIKAVASMKANPGNDLIWHDRTDEAAAKAIFQAGLELAFQKRTREVSSDLITSDPDEIYKDVIAKYGGDAIVEKEKLTGRIVGDISIRSVEKDTTTQALDESKANALLIRDILNIVIPACNNNPVLEQAVGATVIQATVAPATNVNLVTGKSGKGNT